MKNSQNATLLTTSTRSRRAVGGCTFESLQFGDGIGSRGESSGSRSGRSPQSVVQGAARCTRTAIEGTVGSHRRFHRNVTAPHPEVGSRTRSRNGASVFSVAETGTFARADRRGAAVVHPAPSDSAQHKSSSQRISGSCRNCMDPAKRRGVGCDDDVIPTTHKIWTSGLGDRCWSCGTQRNSSPVSLFQLLPGVCDQQEECRDTVCAEWVLARRRMWSPGCHTVPASSGVVAAPGRWSSTWHWWTQTRSVCRPTVPDQASSPRQQEQQDQEETEQGSQIIHREVRATANVVENLGRRIGSVPLEGDVQKKVRHQWWIPVWMFLCFGRQPAIHHRALCWGGSWRQHHRSPNHSSSTKDRSIREAARVEWFALRQVLRRGNIWQHGWDVNVFKPHSLDPHQCPGTGGVAQSFVALVLHVERQSGVPVEVLQQNLHHKTLFPFPRGTHN